MIEYYKLTDSIGELASFLSSSGVDIEDAKVECEVALMQIKMAYFNIGEFELVNTVACVLEMLI